MLSGSADAVWPAALLSELSLSRLAQRAYGYPIRHVAFPQSGHRFVLLTLPGTVTSGRHPADHQVYEYGGTPLGNARVGRRARKEMQDWLAGRRLLGPLVEVELCDLVAVGVRCSGIDV